MQIKVGGFSIKNTEQKQISKYVCNSTQFKIMLINIFNLIRCLNDCVNFIPILHPVENETQ